MTSNSASIRFLEILKPPIISLGLERSKPSAREIKQHDCYPPYEIQKWKTPDVSFRWFWIAHGMIGEEPWADEPKPDLRDHERKCVDQGDVKHVKEERHASEKDDSASESPAGALNEFYKKGCQEKSSRSTGGREDFVSRSSPLHCKSASRFAREVLLLSCLPFL